MAAEDEGHPAWGLIGASRVRSTPGANLFDSDIQHQHYVVVRIAQARRNRRLHHDHIYSDQKRIIEVAMSEAQWASFVSTMNVGDGVPCTIESVKGEEMPRLKHEPRLAESMEEVRGAANEAMEGIQKAFDAYQEKKTAANLRSLKFAIENAPSNITFAASSLTEHAENVVQRARADIESMVAAKATQLGLAPGEHELVMPELEATNEEEER